MKKIILFSAMSLGSLVFAQESGAMVGGNKDAHGCLSSAGYTYSQLKKDCVRSFEQKIKLVEQKPDGTSTSQTGVIFSKDMKKAEIFLPDGKENSMILSKNGKQAIWKNGEYSLLPLKKGYQLKKGNVVIYK